MEEKQYYKEKRISNSSLSYFEQSPLLFKRFLESEIEQEEKRYLNRGKQIHMAILEPDLFKKNYTHVDFEVPKSEQQKQFCEDYIKIDISTLRASTTDHKALIEAYKNNYKTTAKDDKILELAKELKDKLSKYIDYLQKRKQYKDILSWTDWSRITGLKDSVKKHKFAKELLVDDELSSKESYNELVIFWEHPIYKLPCKSMLDRLIIDHEKKEIILIDLKTVNSFKDVRERCREFHYFRQFAFYWLAVMYWLSNEKKLDTTGYSYKSYIVALKTTDDPEVRVYNIEDVYLSEGLDTLNTILPDLQWNWENDIWDYTRKYHSGDGTEKL